jgi:hypothetical protein
MIPRKWRSEKKKKKKKKKEKKKELKIVNYVLGAGSTKNIT